MFFRRGNNTFQSYTSYLDTQYPVRFTICLWDTRIKQENNQQIKEATFSDARQRNRHVAAC